jgi:ABC-type branched-subunit amino acid transport system substrate-binding protein
MRAGLIAVCLVSAVALAACGNAGSSNSKGPVVTTVPGGPTITEASGAELQQNLPNSSQGVTNDAINVAAITSKTNILGGHYHEYVDGIQDYFDYINSQNGIYGRKLKITSDRDDNFLQNEQTVKTSLAQDKAFATFIASPVFSGAPDIAAATSMPTFLWNINPEMAGHPNIFGTIGAICNNCLDMGTPAFLKQEGYSKIGVLAYGVTASSKDCANAVKNSLKKYPTAQVVYFNNSLAFAQPDLSAQVSDMKKAGVQYIYTCIDTSEALILGKELKRQGLNAVQQLPNAYDQQFVQQNAQYLEGDYIIPQFLPPEKDANLPELQLFKQWSTKSGKTVRELTYEGWIAANMFVHALKLAGPNFTQQKVIDSLNQDTNFSANGMIVPIDWTKQHEDPRCDNSAPSPEQHCPGLPTGAHNPKWDGKWNCQTILRVKSGTLVPVLDQPGKPWVCLPGDPNAATIPAATYESFAPAGG